MPFGSSNSPVYYGLLETARGGRTAAYFKRLTLRAILVEIFCAQLARALELPCPTPYLSVGRGCDFGIGTDAPVYLFASQASEHPTLAAILNDPQEAVQILARAKLLHRVIVFDEWIANPDRGLKNLLLDSASGVQLIDHEEALASHVQPPDVVSNWLLDRAAEALSQTDRWAAMNRLRQETRTMYEVPAFVVSQHAHVQWTQGGTAALAALLDLAEQRRHAVDQLLRAKLMPDQGNLRLNLP